MDKPNASLETPSFHTAPNRTAGRRPLAGALLCLVAVLAGSVACDQQGGGGTPRTEIVAEVYALQTRGDCDPSAGAGPGDFFISLSIGSEFGRPVSATADHLEVRDVQAVSVEAAADIELQLLYNPGHGLEERLLREQFTV